MSNLNFYSFDEEEYSLPSDILDDDEITEEELNIHSRNDMFNAVIIYDYDFLSDMDNNLRIKLCNKLLELAFKYQVESAPLWKDVLEDPEYFNVKDSMIEL